MTPPQPDPNQVLRLPAIEIRQGKQRIYMFGIDGKEIPRIATISRVHRDDEGDIGGYQRPEILRSFLEQLMQNWYWQRGLASTGNAGCEGRCSAFYPFSPV